MDSAVGSMPIVLMQPDRQVLISPIRMGVWPGVGPFAQRGLNESFGLAVGFRRIGPGADVPEAELAASVAEVEGFVAGAVIGHHPAHGDAEALVIGDRVFEEGDGADGFFIRLHLDEGDAGSVVDGDMGELPTEPFAARSSTALTGAVAGDPVADAVDAAEFLDVEVDHLAGIGALITPHGFDGIEISHPAQAGSTQDPAHGRRRHADALCDVFAAQTLAAQRDDLVHTIQARRPPQPAWAR